MEIVFLGTGSAVPTKMRNHIGVLLKHEGESMLFDCGEGIQRQFRYAEENPCKLTKIFISHWHGDHVLGIPGLLQSLMLNDYSKTLQIYGPKGTKLFVKKIMDLFVNVGKLDIEVNEISKGKFIDEEDYYLEAFEMDHGTHCLAYSFVEKDKLNIDKTKLEKLKIKQGKEFAKLKQGKDVMIDGKKIKAKDITYIKKGKKFAYVLDSRENSNIIKVAKDADVFICESTYLHEKEMAKEYGHLTAGQAAGYAKKANVKKLFLVHLSQRHEFNSKEFLSEARKIFKNTELAKDLDRFKV